MIDKELLLQLKRLKGIEKELKNGNAAKALIDIENYLKSNPEFRKAIMLYGRILVANGFFADAIIQFKRLLDTPDADEASFMLINLYAHMNEFDKASDRLLNFKDELLLKYDSESSLKMKKDIKNKLVCVEGYLSYCNSMLEIPYTASYFDDMKYISSQCVFYDADKALEKVISHKQSNASEVYFFDDFDLNGLFYEVSELITTL